MKTVFLFLTLFMGLVGCDQAKPVVWQAPTYNGPHVDMGLFCVRPQPEGFYEPNYDSPLIVSAGARISEIPQYGFHLNDVVMDGLGAHDSAGLFVPAPEKYRNKVKPFAHVFLKTLCNEYSDRPSLILEKLQQFSSIQILQRRIQKAIDSKLSVWQQISAQSYSPILAIAKSIYEERLAINSKDTFLVDQIKVSPPVQPLTVCDIKFILNHYVVGKKKWNGLAEYRKNLSLVKAKLCSDRDLSRYLTFRGHTNLSPYSPASNAVLYSSQQGFGACAYNKNSDFCRSYLQQPFAVRWQHARAGLAAWMLIKKESISRLRNTRAAITTYMNDFRARMPFALKDSSNEKSIAQVDSDRLKLWTAADFGLGSLLTTETGQGELLSRLSAFYQRHTYFSTNNFVASSGRFRRPFYLPTVASSFDPSRSDNFTVPGETVELESPGHRMWMMVFATDEKHIYNSEKFRQRQPIDFDLDWFDNSLANSKLADLYRERIRLAEPIEGEYEALLWLQQVPSLPE